MAVVARVTRKQKGTGVATDAFKGGRDWEAGTELCA
jgi:hypothetical protein